MKIKFTYEVKLPEFTSRNYENLVLSYLNTLDGEDYSYWSRKTSMAFQGDQDAHDELDSVLAYYLIAEYHVGSYTEYVQELDSVVEEYKD